MKFLTRIYKILVLYGTTLVYMLSFITTMYLVGAELNIFTRFTLCFLIIIAILDLWFKEVKNE